MAWEGNNALKKKKQSEASVEIKDGGKHKQLAPNQTISLIAADIQFQTNQSQDLSKQKTENKQTKNIQSDLQSLWVGTGGGGLRAQALSGNIRLCAFALSVEVADPR